MKSHPLTGYVLLHYYFGSGHRIVEDPSFEHHERLDGTGYPRRVRKMNKYSQVIAVADVFDALLSRRPYRREPFTLRAALDHLLDEARGGRLNPVFVLLLISYARKSKPALRGPSHRRKKAGRSAPAQHVRKNQVELTASTGAAGSFPPLVASADQPGVPAHAPVVQPGERPRRCQCRKTVQSSPAIIVFDVLEIQIAGGVDFHGPGPLSVARVEIIPVLRNTSGSETARKSCFPGFPG